MNTTDVHEGRRANSIRSKAINSSPAAETTTAQDARRAYTAPTTIAPLVGNIQHPFARGSGPQRAWVHQQPARPPFLLAGDGVMQGHENMTNNKATRVFSSSLELGATFYN